MFRVRKKFAEKSMESDLKITTRGHECHVVSKNVQRAIIVRVKFDRKTGTNRYGRDDNITLKTINKQINQ